MANVDDIVRGLTKARADALIASPGNGLWNDGRFTFVGQRRPASELYDSGLIEPAEPNGLWACYSLTDLGKLVRARLLSSSGATDHAQ